VTAILTVENLSFQYRTRPDIALSDVSFSLEAGEMLLIAGASGCGKTTLARCINGLIPRSYGGERTGKVLLNGVDVKDMSLVEISQTVGTLLQDPERQIVASNVYNEIAFGPENLGMPREEILERVESAMRRLKIEYLRERSTFSLSGGEKQKVALAGLLAMNPSVLLLDEPLASLDPASAHEALQIFRSLADEGKTIILVEHRVEDAIDARPDRLLYMEKGQVYYLGPIKSLPEKLDPKQVKVPAEWVVERAKSTGEIASPPEPHPARVEKEPLVQFEGVHFRYDDELPFVLKDVNFSIYEGDLIAVLGPNGVGKSTLVKHAIGLLKPTQGRVLVHGQDTRKMTVAQIAHTLGYVFQSPTHMLFAPSVQEEVEFGPKNLHFAPNDLSESARVSIDTLNLGGLEQYPPLGLSFGQQKRTTIAAVMAMRSQILVMDEPTAGQDFANYTRFMDALCTAQGQQKSLLASNFAATLFITHDVDLAVTYANRVLLIGEGRVVADGKPEEVLKDFEQLQKHRVRPTSLLRLNLAHLPQTGRFLPADALAAYV
jgi:energy-coupling factor transport system ATP-binding protein